jgi:pectinesterase
MLELTVNAKSPAAITTAFKRMHEMVMTGAVEKGTTFHLVLGPGLYRESIRYNMSNPLIMESAPGLSAAGCTIMADNCEAFHRGRENRSIFFFGPNATSVTLKNFTVENTHLKSVEVENTKPDSAEAFVWDNSSGTLKAEGMAFVGRQNTLFVRGFSWFLGCRLEGDTDIVYGEPDLSVFEDCTVHVRDDNRGDYNGYAVKSRTDAGKKGFVFSGCTFTGEKRKKSSLYVYRTAGLGKASTGKDFDNAAFLNCRVSEFFSPEFEWDDDMQLDIYPRGNAESGIREYGTKTLLDGGGEEPADTARRNVKSYTLTDDDYFKMYSSRFLIFGGTPLAARLE